MTIAPDDEELTIKTGGVTLGGWEQFRVSRSVENCASYITVGLSERYPDQLRKTSFEPFDTCEAYLSGDKILTGYVDRYLPAYDAHDHPVTMSGRSKTEDLVDCAVDIENLGGPGKIAWSVSAATIGEAAKRVCDPYKIDVTGDGMGEKLDTSYPFIVNPGMTCWQLLEELARAAQVLIWDDEQGRLVLSKVGTKRAGSALVEGQNCEVAEAAFTADQRFSDIWVLGQGPTPGTDGHLGDFARRHDSRVPRRRIHMIVMDKPGDGGKWAAQRAEWEIARRYGRSRQVVVTVTGWRDGAGRVWTPNTLVRLSCPTLKIDEDWLIAECAWTRGPRGTQTTLHCMPKEGLIPQPFIPLQPIPLN